MVKKMLDNKNKLFLLCLMFCLSGSAADNYPMGNDINIIDSIGFASHGNVDNNEMVVVLRDTSYAFPISEIELMSFKENTLLENNKCNFFDLGLNASGQSGIIINDTVIIFNTGGAATATAMLTNEKTAFNPECIDYHPHCNVANYYYKNGRHYVYLSEWDGQHRCFVEELYYDNSTKCWISKLVQIISMDIDDSIRGNNNMDWIVDSENDMLYTQTYKDGSSRTATGLIYMQFKLPSLKNNREVTIREDQIIRRTEYPMIYITQDKFIHRGKMFVASGWGGSQPGMVTVIDLTDFHIDEVYDLSYRDDEPEMIDIYKDNLLVFYWSKNFSVQNKKSLYVHLTNGMCLSYPTSNIKEIILQ